MTIPSSPQSAADYAEFHSGGYLLIRTAHVPEWFRTRPLLPAVPLSVSSCQYPRFPDFYAISWCQSEPEADQTSELWSFESMGIPVGVRAAATDWATDTFDVEHGAWGIFFRIDDARDACRRFLDGVSDVRLLGIGLHQSLIADYLEQTRPRESEPRFAPDVCGQWMALDQRKPLEPVFGLLP